MTVNHNTKAKEKQMEKNIHGTCPRSTPWGHADHQETIAPGIVEVSTPSHGGVWLSAARVLEMPEMLRAQSRFNNNGNWFEEDCDRVLVVLSFPKLFSPFSVYHALKAARSMSTPDWDYFKFNVDTFCSITEQGRQAFSMAGHWFFENKDKFMFGCQGGGSGGCWGGLDRIDGGESLRYKCAKWPTLHQPFTLDQARADGLEILPIAPSVIAPEPVKFRPVNTPDAGPAHDHRYYQPFDESQCGGVFDGIGTVTSDADSGL